MARLSGLIYRASNGETFDSVSLQVYGDEKYTGELMSANPLLVDKAVFMGGEEIKIPVVTVSVTDENGNAYGTASAPWK